MLLRPGWLINFPAQCKPGPDQLHLLAGALPASITFIGEVGHLMMLEQPQAFAQEIA